MGSDHPVSVNRRTLQPGETLLGRYRLISQLGKGAQGEVYQVEDPTGARFAAKVAPGKEGAQERVRREAIALSRVHSPHVVPYVDSGRDSDLGWVLVLGLLPGVTLSRLRPGPPFWTLPRVIQLGEQVAAGLQAISDAHLVMRDLSPAQIIVSQTQERLSICLVDLGLARGEGAPSDLTDPRLIAGTPGFTAPEWVLRGTGGPSADVYSLAAVLWWTLFGTSPFGSGRAELALGLQLSGYRPKVRLSELHWMPCAKELAGLLEGSLSPEPLERPPTPNHFASVLKGLA